jgi:hypothetical protein
MAAPQNIIGIVYDYDQTLSPHYMQNQALFARFDIDPVDFWIRSNVLVSEKQYDPELAYMRVMLEYPQLRDLSNNDLKAMGAELTFYPGIPEMFDELSSRLRVAPYVDYDIHIEHYIVSSGLKGLIEGSQISAHVKAIFGCEFDEGENGKICFPKRVISHTQKTQFLFRVNKGLLDLDQDVNDHMPHELRRIPFSNMVYIGDGPTDVPCFAVMKKNGGFTIAVYNPDDAERKAFRKCYQLSTHTNRVHHIAPADYRSGGHLRLILEQMVEEIADGIVNRRRTEADNSRIAAPSF